MYFWNDKQLAVDLKEGKVSENEKFRYFLAYYVFLSVTGFYISSQMSFLFRTFNMSIALILEILGLIFCYKENKNVKNGIFIERFFCLLLPVNIKIYVYFIGGLFLFSTITGIIFTDFYLFFSEPPFYNYFTSFYSAIMIIYLFRRLIFRFREINKSPGKVRGRVT